MDFYDKLIDLRITLMNKCDGFSQKDASKNLLLSSKIKVLFLLSQKDMMQGELIESLAMAKSNLANLLKSMMSERLIENYRVEGNLRNIYYKITCDGEDQLYDYKMQMKKEFSRNCTSPDGHLDKIMDELLTYLKGEN